MKQYHSYQFLGALQNMPNAYAIINGSRKHPTISGYVSFYQVSGGVLVQAEVNGLPVSTDICHQPVFGFHIHEGGACTGTAELPFENAKGHYNPRGCAHPYHAGDMPPLFGNGGYAWSVFFTDRFMAKEIIGKTVIVHAHPDDFTSQPSGNAGEMMACGVIR